jgi:hypothetical protein
MQRRFKSQNRISFNQQLPLNFYRSAFFLVFLTSKRATTATTSSPIFEMYNTNHQGLTNLVLYAAVNTLAEKTGF